MANINSHKYQLNDPQNIDISKLNTIGVENNFGEKYIINYKELGPIENGTVEMKFQFLSLQNKNSGEIKKAKNDNFTGIGFNIAGDGNFFAVLLYQTGKVTLGKFNEKPLVTRHLNIQDTTPKYQKIKISFLEGHLIVFLDGAPIIKYKPSPLKKIDNLAIITKFNDQPEKKKTINVRKDSFKYSKLKTVSYRNSKKIFDYLEQENILRGDRIDENNGGMNIFETPPEFAKNKNRKTVFIGDVTIKSETRQSIYAPAPTKIVYSLTIPEDSYLSFAYAIPQVGWDNSDGVLFSITFKSKNIEKKSIFSEFLNPEKNQNRRWIEEMVDLSQFAGLSGDLILETIPSDNKRSDSKEGSKLFDFGLWGSPAIYHKNNSNQFNVILISLDTLRAGHLGAYGYFRNTSPKIDMLAKNGTLFKNTITQSPWTLPSHMSMFTSLYPSELGYSIMNRIQKKVKIFRDATTLAEILKENGYLTAGLTGGANVSKVFGFNQGFSFYNERWGTEIDKEYKYVSDWIQKNHMNKFFLFFHTFEIHDYPPGKHEMFTAGINPQDKKEYKKALYDGKIKYVDGYIGLLIDKLESLNLLDKTLIVITSDHGEEFYEHGTEGHGEQFYDEVLLVPLIFHLKDIVPKKTVINDQARVIDVMPTILDILNITTPKNIEGTSLVPFFKENANTHLSAFTEAADYHGIVNRFDLSSIRTLKYKYIHYPTIEKDALAYLKSMEKETGLPAEQYNPGEGELYDLLKDPGEQSNIIDLKSSVASDLKEEIKSLMKKNQKKNITKDKIAETVVIDKVTKEKLESLGYIQ